MFVWVLSSCVVNYVLCTGVER